MIRELASVLLIAALFAAALLNAGHIGKFTDSLKEDLQLSLEKAESGDTDGARELAEEGLRRWTGFRDYACAVMRHEEIDAVSGAFYQLFAALNEDDPDAVRAGYRQLIYQLEVIAEREHVTVRSVF